MAHSSESSDEEAPEAYSFSSSKKAAKLQDEALQKFRAEEKQKLKDKRRERDRVLKERKAQAKDQKNAVEEGETQKKGKGKETNVEVEDSESEGEESSDEIDGKDRAELEARMAKAMKDAEDEEADEHSGLEEESDSQHEADSSSVDGSSSDEDNDEGPSKPLSKKPKLSKSSDYLPDHLFASALSEAATLTAASKGAKSKVKPSVAATKPRKRKRSTHGPKDVVIGTRTVRTLSAPSQSAAPPSKTALAPPPAVTRFVSRTLNLRSKESTTKAKGWERRSANVGVMKRNGPAAQFVRG